MATPAVRGGGWSFLPLDNEHIAEKKMQISQPQKFVRKLLVLIALIATISFGWLVGHIVRFSIPTYQHPPIEEVDPHIQKGFQLEFQGIRRQFVWTGVSAARIPGNEGAIIFGDLTMEQCLGSTYYTSLPAKCHTADGRLVRVGGSNTVVVVPPDGE